MRDLDKAFTVTIEASLLKVENHPLESKNPYLKKVISDALNEKIKGAKTLCSWKERNVFFVLLWEPKNAGQKLKIGNIIHAKNLHSDPFSIFCIFPDSRFPFVLFITNSRIRHRNLIRFVMRLNPHIKDKRKAPP